MARAYSQDLRDRVIDAALAGAPARHVAARFGVGDATAIVWMRRARETGERKARKQGQPRRSKLHPHRDYLLGLIAATPDLTISELLAQLLADRGVSDPRWLRVLARDRSADGQFWYSVTTTKVYCHPSCPSRTANPKNVRLHDGLEEAKATGFRPCKRRNPDGISQDAANSILIEKACRLVEESEEALSLSNLADAIGLSPHYFHRLFKSETGLTPKGYAAAHRAKRVRRELLKGRSVTEAVYDSGFNSSGRFYEKSAHILGMTPTQYRARGANENIRFAVGQSSLGAILVASSEKGVVSILIGDDPDSLVRELQDCFAKANLMGGDSDYEALVAHVVGFVEASAMGLDLPLDVRGTAFQQRVSNAKVSRILRSYLGSNSRRCLGTIAPTLFPGVLGRAHPRPSSFPDGVLRILTKW